MNQHQTETGVQTFSRFTEFPQELQDQIWGDAISNVSDRIVEIRHGQTIISSCPIPPLLHACQSSRLLALKRWKLSFAKSDRRPRTFFDHSRDTLYFGQYFPNMDEFGGQNQLASGMGAGVCRIAFSLESQWGDSNDTVETRAFKIHGSFPDLKHITFMNMNLDFDFEAHEQGEPQPAPDPQKRLVTFKEIPYNDHGSTIHLRLLHKLESAFQRQRWEFPTWNRMDYQYVHE